MKTVEAAKILDQATEAETYAKKLLVKIQNAYRTRKINIYDYEDLLINEDIQKKHTELH